MHRVHGGSEPNAAAPDPPALPNCPRPVVVAAMGGNRALPVDPEPDDDHEPGHLVIAECVVGKVEPVPESTSKLRIYFLTFGGARGGQEVSFMLQSWLLDPVGAPGHGGKAYFPT